MRFFVNAVRFVLVAVVMALILAACSDEATPPPPLTTTAITPETGGETPAPANPPAIVPATATTSPDNAAEDNNAAYTPGATVAANFGGTPQPRVTGSLPTSTPAYGNLPPPPRTLAPRPAPTAAPNTNRAPWPKNSFVVSTTSGLYLLNSDGQDDRSLASGTAFSNPEISPDGTRVAVFRIDPITLRNQLYLIDSAGVSQIISEDGGSIQHFAWSPDGKTLALTRASDNNNDGLTDENDKANIWLYDLASNKQQQVAEGRNASWSADGVRLVFVIPGPPTSLNEIDPATRKPRLSPNSIGVYNVQNSGKRNLVSSDKLSTTLNGATDDPALKNRSLNIRYFKRVAWHPDNKHITVSADAAGPENSRLGLIFTLTLDDATPRLLTGGGDAAVKLAWSPDSKRLVYEIEPQFPLALNSRIGPALALFDNPDFATPHPTKIFLGDPATRNYTRAPIWLNAQQLAYLKGDSGILAFSEADGKNERTLISGCTGFDFFS